MVPIRYNIRGLMVRRMSTIASALGIGMVVFVLATALMLANGIKQTLGRSGKNDVAVVLRKGSDNEMMSGIEESTQKLILSAPGIKREADGTPLTVGEIVVVIVMEKVGGQGLTNMQIRGVPDQVLRFRPETRIISGRPAQVGTNEAIAGKRLVGQFKGVALGQSFELRKNKPVTIVGIFDDGGSSFESEVWVGLDTVKAAFGREGSISSVRAQLSSASAFDGFSTFVEQDKRLGLMAMRETKYLEKQSEGTSLFVSMMGAVIAVFFSIGAMIGAMITMYTSIFDRRREIGVLRALGFSRSGILLSFLLESVLLALAGGVLGVAGALGMGFIRISMMNFNTWSEIVFSLSPSPSILITSFIAAGLMGLLGGFFPAIRAARVSPIEAMRG